MRAVIFANSRGSNDEYPAFYYLYGISLLQRHIRTLQKIGFSSITIIVPGAKDTESAHPTPMAPGTESQLVTYVEETQFSSENFTDGEPVFIAAGDYVIEKQLIEHLLKKSETTLLVEMGGSRGMTSVGCAIVRIEELKHLLENGLVQWDSIFEELIKGSAELVVTDTLSPYDFSIRRKRPSYWARIKNRQHLQTAAVHLMDGVQKGSSDIPAKLLHAPIENFIVSALSLTQVTPNQVTLITNIAAWSVTCAILMEHLWVGLLGAACVGVLDGVDGKLARLKIMTSRIGEYEHLFDLAFETSWWLSLGFVLGGRQTDSELFLAGVSLVLFWLADIFFAILFWLRLGKRHQRTLDNYTPFDHFVRKIAGRRNIYIWLILFAAIIVGLEQALWLCVIWGAMTISIRALRTLWLINRREIPVDFSF